MWARFRQRFGLKTDRIVWAVANGAAVTAGTWGSKYTNADIVPKFGSTGRASLKKLAYQLAGLPGAEVEFIGKDGTILKGDEALAKMDNYRTDGKRIKTLDEKTPPKSSRRKDVKTLGGD